MRKYVLDEDVAVSLANKLINDTLNNNITWVKMPIDEFVDIPVGSEVPLTTARNDYHFEAELPDGMVGHFQRWRGYYFIWIMGESETIAYFKEDLYLQRHVFAKVVNLAEAIRQVTYEEDKLMDEIMAYIGK